LEEGLARDFFFPFREGKGEGETERKRAKTTGESGPSGVVGGLGKST